MILKFQSITLSFVLGLFIFYSQTLCMECMETSIQEEAKRPHALGREISSQEELNQFVGKRAVELYQMLHNCSRYPNQEKGERFPHIPGNVWEIGSWGSIVLISKANKHVKASAALNQIFNNKENILDCATAMYIVTAQCISEIFGSSFDKLYESAEASCHNKKLYLPQLIMQLSMVLSNVTIKDISQSGCLVQFRNFPSYSQLNPKGSFSNDNLITTQGTEDECIKYMGFGEEYSNGPLSYDSVKNYLLRAFNIGSDKQYMAYKVTDLDTILSDRLGFGKGSDVTVPSETRPSFISIKKRLQQSIPETTQIYPNNPLQSIIFDEMQNYLVFCLSFEKIIANKNQL